MPNFHKPHQADEYDFMNPKAAATQLRPRKFAVMMFIGIGSFVAFFLLWAFFADIDVITRGNGRVIPSQKTQIISHLEGGIIKDVLIKEGELVDADQVLMRLDPVITKAHYKTNREQYLRYLAAASRLEAQLQGKKYQVPEQVRKESPLIATEEMKHYVERKEQLETQQSIAKQVVIQKKQEVEQGKAKITQAQEQLALSEKEVQMVGPLVEEELISKREILRLQRDTANLKGEVATGKAALPKNQAAYEQAQYELKQIPIRFQNEDQEQLREMKLKLAEEQGAMLESQNRMTRTEIRSPVKGIVKEIKLKTLGGTVRGGDEIITIVPYEDTLLIEGLILPSDVAFIHPGQDATIKIMAYDYAIYGSLKARLLEVSADTVHDPEQKRDFYRVLLRSDKNYLEHNNKKLPIIPGMTVEVNILTGTRTVMEYLLKPIIRGVSTSMTEK